MNQNANTRTWSANGNQQSDARSKDFHHETNQFLHGFGEFLKTQEVGRPVEPHSPETAAFGAYCREARRRLALSVHSVAQRGGLPPATVHAIEYGTLSPSEITDKWLDRLAAGLESDPEALLDALGMRCDAAPRHLRSRLYDGYRRYHTLLMVICDAATLALAFFAAYYARFFLVGPAFGRPGPEMNYLQFGGVALTATLVIFWIAALYDRELSSNDTTEFPQIFYACSFGALILIFLGFVFPAFGESLSRGWLVTAWFWAVVFASLCRYLLHRTSHWMALRGYPRHFAVILGTGWNAQQLYQRHMQSPQYALGISGFVGYGARKPNDAHELYGVPILGSSMEELSRIVVEEGVDEILVTERLLRRDFIDLLELADQHGLRIRSILHSDQMFTRQRSGSVDFASTPLVTVNMLRLAPFPRFVKRTADVLVSLAGLIIFSPFFLLVAVHNSLLGHKRLLVGEEMFGLNGSRFERWCFFLPKDNCRLGWIDRSHLKSIPHLLNIVRGDMSMVGPEPLPTYMIDEFGRHEFLSLTLRARPGLTGLWRVAGMKTQTITQKIRLDLYYLSHYSLLRDAGILLVRTLPMVPSMMVDRNEAPILIPDADLDSGDWPDGGFVQTT